MGCWQFGSKDWGYGKEYGETTAVDIVHTALDLGVTLIDTAEAYARGASEAIVGRSLIGRRGEAFVATKFTPLAPIASRGSSTTDASRRCDSVSTPIDLYQIHWPNPVFPLAPQLEGMRTLLDEGVIANVGVSNFGADRWAKADGHLGRPVLSNQVHFSLLYRKPDTANVPFAQANDRIVIAYSPLEMGVLGGKYSADNPPPGAARSRSPLCLPENLARGRAAARDAAADRRGARRDAGAGRARVADPQAQRGGDPRRELGRPAPPQRRRRPTSSSPTTRPAELTAESDAFTPIGGVDTAKGMVRRRRAG